MVFQRIRQMPDAGHHSKFALHQVQLYEINGNVIDCLRKTEWTLTPLMWFRGGFENSKHTSISRLNFGVLYISPVTTTNGAYAVWWLDDWFLFIIAFRNFICINQLIQWPNRMLNSFCCYSIPLVLNDNIICAYVIEIALIIPSYLGIWSQLQAQR